MHLCHRTGAAQNVAIYLLAGEIFLEKMPSYNSKMRQKQQKRAFTFRTDYREANKLKTLTKKRLSKLRHQRRMDSSSMANEPEDASTSRTSQAMNISTDSEQFTQTNGEGKEKTLNTNQRAT